MLKTDSRSIFWMILHYYWCAYPKSKEDLIRIYSSGNIVFINNHTGVDITNIRIFNILGQPVRHEINYASPDLSTVQINEPAGYYITQVTVDKHVYTEKGFIKNF